MLSINDKEYILSVLVDGAAIAMLKESILGHTQAEELLSGVMASQKPVKVTNELTERQIKRKLSDRAKNPNAKVRGLSTAELHRQLARFITVDDSVVVVDDIPTVDDSVVVVDDTLDHISNYDIENSDTEAEKAWTYVAAQPHTIEGHDEVIRFTLIRGYEFKHDDAISDEVFRTELVLKHNIDNNLKGDSYMEAIQDVYDHYLPAHDSDIADSWTLNVDEDVMFKIQERIVLERYLK